MINTRLKKKIQEGITNLSSMGQIPTDEVTLNLEVLYDSILNEVCSVVPMESPRQVVSCLKLIHDSEEKTFLTGDIQKDAFKLTLMNGVGAVPFDDYGYPTQDVSCSIVANDNNEFLANYSNIIPGTVNIEDEYIDDGNGKIINKETKAEIGTVDYLSGLFKFTGDVPAAVVRYKYDIYNLEYQRNFAKFVKSSIEVFADMYALDIDSALVLNDFKGLNLKENINNIIPQVLTQQIDGFILSKYFKQAEQQVIGTFNSTIVPPTIYADLGTFISNKTNEYVSQTGVMPNVILCDAKGYSLLSANVKFQPINDEEHKIAGTPKLVGYFNNFKVILTNIESKVSIVLTYKGDSDAQVAGVYAPYIPVTLRTVDGSEGGGMIVTTNAYSFGGFVMINPDLVKGIVIE